MIGLLAPATVAKDNPTSWTYKLYRHIYALDSTNIKSQSLKYTAVDWAIQMRDGIPCSVSVAVN